jgi:hypothetical protein
MAARRRLNQSLSAIEARLIRVTRVIGNACIGGTEVDMVLTGPDLLYVLFLDYRDGKQLTSLYITDFIQWMCVCPFYLGNAYNHLYSRNAGAFLPISRYSYRSTVQNSTTGEILTDLDEGSDPLI